MSNTKTVKIAIIACLIIIEAFVWTITSPINAWSSNFDDDINKSTAPPSQNNGQAVPLPTDKPKDQEPPSNTQLEERSVLLDEAKAKGLLILVNKQHSLDSGYKPEDLEPIKYYAPDRAAISRYMRAEAAAAFHSLVERGAAEGIEIVMTTAYRPYDFQKILYNNYVAEQGQAAADKFSAKPGQSEHQTGLSVDVSAPSVGYDLTSLFGETTEGVWLAEHAHEYGFIIRFPKGKEDITGYMYEPWHIRYVGQQAAEEIYEQKLTLEEFLEQNNW